MFKHPSILLHIVTVLVRPATSGVHVKDDIMVKAHLAELAQGNESNKQSAKF